MVQDVYSGDDDQRRVDRCAIVHVPLAFHVRADAAPDTLARILNILALSNLSPLSCRAATHADDHMDITVQFGRLPETMGSRWCESCGSSPALSRQTFRLKRTSRKSPAAGRRATGAVDARSYATAQRIADKSAAAPAICSACGCRDRC